MFIDKRHCPRRTFLRGIGATLALPLLDSMVPALTARRQDGCQSEARGSGSSTCRTAIDHGRLDADDGGRRLRVHADPEAARAVPRVAGGRQRPRAHRAINGSHADGGSVAHRRASPRRTDRPRISAPARRSIRWWRSRSGRTRPFPRSRSRTEDFTGLGRRLRSRIQLRVHEHARPGRRRPRRCRWRSTRAWCSSGCSAAPARATQRLARMRTDRSILDSVQGRT